MITAAYFIVTLLLATVLYFGIRWFLNLDVALDKCLVSGLLARTALSTAPAARLRHVTSNLCSEFED